MADFKYTQFYLTENDCYKQGKKMKPVGIVVHSTGANNKTLKRYVGPDDGKLGKNLYGNHWNQGGHSKCVHAFIGVLNDGTLACYQTLPWDMKGWHAGGAANNTHIGFEICEDAQTDKKYFEESYEMAAQLCAFLAKKYGIKVKDIISHKEAHDMGLGSNHGDPHYWWKRYGKNMDTFRERVSELMGNVKVEVEEPSKPATEKKEDTPKKSEYYKVTNIPDNDPGLNMRSTPANNGKVVAVLKKNTVVISTGNTKNGWYEVDYNKKIGWVWPDYLVKTTKPAESSGSSTNVSSNFKEYAATVNTSGTGLNVRKGPGTSYDIIGSLKNKASCTIIEEKNDWGKVKEKNGWVSLAYIKKTKAETKEEKKEDYWIYTAKQGDNLWAIARTHLGAGKRMDEIMELNGLKSDIVRPGDKFKIPNK